MKAFRFAPATAVLLAAFHLPSAADAAETRVVTRKGTPQPDSRTQALASRQVLLNRASDLAGRLGKASESIRRLDLRPETHGGTVVPVSCGATINSALDASSCGTSGLCVDFYSISATGNSPILITVRSNAFTPLVTVQRASDGRVLDYRIGGDPVSFPYTPSATTPLAIGVAAVQSFASGAYTLAVACPSVAGGGAAYSVEVPVVTKVVGTALFRTAIDISNNSASDYVVAEYQYSYVRTSDQAFFRTPLYSTTLRAFDNFHQDDFVLHLSALAILEAGADQSSFGSLLITFRKLQSELGWEGTAFARTYSPNPTGPGTVAIAYPGSLFFESANQALVATIRDTQAAPSAAGALRTNIGVRNTDVLGTGQNVTVQLSFYDVTSGSATNGQRVGNVLTISNLQPGQVQQINNVRAAAAIPDGVTAMLAFGDIVGATATSPTIEGYVNILDGGTQDGAFFEMKCADTDGCD